VAIILTIGVFDVRVTHGCQALITSHVAFAYLAIAAASFLIVLRIIAIWNRKTVIIAIAIGVWVIDISFLFVGVLRLRASWVPSQGTCMSHNVQSNKPTSIATLVSDVILLLIMLVGLLRMRIYGGGTLHLGRLLWTQGIIWLLLATIAGVPPAVFISLDLNDMLSIMFQLPALVTISICATRMYRSLGDFVVAHTDFIQDSPQGSGSPVSKIVQTQAAPGQLSRTEITGRISDTQYP